MAVDKHRDEAWQRLTPREREICGTLGNGLTNRQIAAQLGISEHTARNHIREIFRTLQVRTRGEVTARYLLENPFTSHDEKHSRTARSRTTGSS